MEGVLAKPGSSSVSELPRARVPALRSVGRSSNVVAVGHDGSHFWVRFKAKGDDEGPGAAYRFPTVGSEHVEGMVRASSPGSYFAQHIRPHHKGEKVEEIV